NFSELAKSLGDNEKKIVDELSTVQGQPVDMGGYFMPDVEIVEKLMRPSDTLNGILSNAFSA
ncbi:MAG: NADP-dependent isocitrate dehydrogenase, partial [Gammaproteobacteria bacterium]|nr:NADP-dependent isocitrate dehydrogenase [Gammaproteobacteria bacterium]